MKDKKLIATIRLYLIIAFVAIPSLSFSQKHLFFPSEQTGVGASAYYDGFWGDEQIFHKQNIRIYGDYDSFIIYSPKCHPSQYCIKLTIDNFHKPTKEEAKSGWVTFTGKIEYYVNEEHPTIKDVFKGQKWGLYGPLDGTHPVKRIANAIIKIANFKKHPKTYNIWFDDVGLAIFLYKAEFK